MDNIPQTNFRSDDTRQNIEKTNKVPQCILDRPPMTPDRQPLTDAQLKDAKSQLLNKEYTKLSFPRNMKFRVDPTINGQKFGLISFIPSKGASPDNEGCFGILKLRGNFGTEEDADLMSENLIRNYDSFAEIDVVFVGRDFPLMINNDMYVAQTREIDIRKKIDDVTKSHLKQKKEQEEKEIKEIQERQQKLMDRNHTEEKECSITDLDYYLQLKVKSANAQMTIDQCDSKKKEAQSVYESAEKDIADLDAKFPDYNKEYLARYKLALSNVGANVNDNPLIKYMDKQVSKQLETIAENSDEEKKN